MALVSNPAMTAASTATLKGSRTRSRLKTMLVVLLAVIVSLLVILFRSPEQAAAARAQRLEMLQQQRAETALHVERLRNLAHKVQEAIQNGDQFTQASFLRRSSAFSAMLESLERLASANHLQPQETTYRINPPDNDLGLQNVEVQLTLEGEYPDLVRFVNQLEQEDLFWIVRGLEVSSSGDKRLRLNVSAQTYLLPS